MNIDLIKRRFQTKKGSSKFAFWWSYSRRKLFKEFKKSVNEIDAYIMVMDMSKTEVKQLLKQ